MKKFNKSLVVTTLSLSLVLGFTGINVALAAGPATVNLGSAGNFTILAKTGISTTGTTSVVGDIGVSPAAATYITGFSLSLPSASAFSTSPLVTGKVYAPGYADPTPANLTTAVSDMQTAYTDAQGRTNPTATELGAGNIGGMSLAPGLYKWGTGVAIPSDITLTGSASDVWIFQIAQNLNVSSATKVLLSGGAQAGNIFWVVAGQTTIGTAAVFNGNILSQTAIVLNTGATLNGRALAQTAVTLDVNVVTVPVASAVVVTPAPVTVVVVPAPVVVAPVAPVSQTSSNANGSNSGSSVVSTLTPVTSNVTDTGCSSGNKFSLVTGKNCNSQAGANVAAPVASSFGQKVRMIAINLGVGSNNESVTTLQQFLIAQNKGKAAAALAAHGTTKNFGSLTRAALAEFQASVGISPAIGNFGAKTRAYISSHY